MEQLEVSSTKELACVVVYPPRSFIVCKSYDCAYRLLHFPHVFSPLRLTRLGQMLSPDTFVFRHLPISCVLLTRARALIASNASKHRREKKSSTSLDHQT